MREKILKIIEDICEDDIIYKDLDIDLFENDIFDSFDFVELLVNIEDVLEISISPSEVSREDMATPNKIIAIVEARILK